MEIATSADAKKPWKKPGVKSEAVREPSVALACVSGVTDGCILGQYYCSVLSDCIPCQDPCEAP